MSKKYKVHENFELEHLSWDEENCHCNSPGMDSNYASVHCGCVKFRHPSYITKKLQ